MDSKMVNLLDVLLILVKNKKYIIIFTMIMSIIAVTYTLVVAEKWSSEAVVVPISSSPISLSSNFMETLGLGGNSSISASTMKYSAILKSKHFSKRVVREFDLINYFSITSPDSAKAMKFAVDNLHSSILNFYINQELSFLTIKATTTDKVLSKNIAEFYLNYLVDYIQDNKTNIGKQKRELLEQRITDIESQIIQIAEELKEYKDEYNIIELQEQAKAALEGYNTILTEYFTNEIELNYAEKFTPNSMQYKEYSAKKDVLNNVLKKFEVDNKDLPYLISFKKTNEHLLTIQQKIYAIELYNAILANIYPQYELAKIEELDEMDQIEVIDYPEIEGMRTSPKRAMICVVVFMVSLFFSCFVVVLINIFDENQKEKIILIWKNLFRLKNI